MGRPALGTREEAIARLSAEHFDLLVIGGGITGAGIALDAATRGLKVALIEKDDFASGTSSRSTKLVHGGLRYLEQRDFGLTYEALHERDLLRRIAPHLVRPIPFLWPRWAGAGPKAGLGLWIYDVMAGIRNIKRHERVNEAGAIEVAPSMRKRTGGYIYHDAQTDDARLTIAVLRAAVRAGAVICNHIKAGDLLEASGRAFGSDASDMISGTAIQIRAGDVVSATGVWADDLRVKEDPSATRLLRPSKGIHLVLPADKLRLSAAVLFPVARGKMAFAIPWRSSVLVGTTDEEYQGLLDAPAVQQHEVDALLGAVTRAFEVDVSPNDLSGAFAGLRPLLQDPKRTTTRDLSRKHAIMRGPKGLVTVTGGKLTTYRKMAEEVVDLVARRQGRYTRCVTKATRLIAGDVLAIRTAAEGIAVRLELPQGAVDHLVMSYGDDAVRVLEMAREMELTTPLVEGLPYIAAEAAWACSSEMAVTASDLLARRTRLTLEDPAAGATAASTIAEAISCVAPERAESFARTLDDALAAVSRERGPVAPGPVRS